jgi:predicted dehydrogenase
MSLTKELLIVGVGSIGERHLRCFAATQRVRLSICELNDALRQNVATRYPVASAFKDLEAALEAQARSGAAVVICTPAHTHIPIAIQAAKAGAHLLIEKPLSTSLEGLADLKHEVGQRNLVASVAYVYRSHPVLAAMRDAIRSGRFGEPLEVVAVFGQHFPFYRPAYRQTYYTSRATGGGAIQDALTHVINAAEWVVGPVDSVVADADHQALEGVEVEDTVHVLTRHGRVMGSFSLNQHQAPNEGTLTVICRNGVARFEMHSCRWLWAMEPGAPWHTEPAGTLERDTLFTLQAGAFLDVLDGKGAPLCPLDQAVQTLRVNLAIMNSAANRAWQDVSTIQ